MLGHDRVACAGDLLQEREFSILRLGENGRDLKSRRRMEDSIESIWDIHDQAPISRTNTRCQMMLPATAMTKPASPSTNGITWSWSSSP